MDIGYPFSELTLLISD